MSRRITRREKILLATAAAAVLVFFLSKWYVIPFFRFASGAGDAVEEKVSVMAALQGIVAREGVLEEEKKELEKALAQYKNFFLPSDKVPLAAADLETRLKELAGKAGLNIVSGKILDHREGDYYTEIPVQIVATGKIDAIRDFVVLVESADVYIGIREMNLRSLTRRQPKRGTQARGGNGEIQATMTLAGLIPV